MMLTQQITKMESTSINKQEMFEYNIISVGESGLHLKL